MTDDEHVRLARILHEVEGRVAISGYSCDLMDELYGDWRRIDADSSLCHSVKGERQESLWVNYEL